MIIYTIIALITLIITEILTIRLAKIISQDKLNSRFVCNFAVFILCLVGFVLSLYLAITSTENYTPYIWLKIFIIYFMSLLLNFYFYYFFKDNNIKQKNQKNHIIKLILFILTILSIIILIILEF